MRTFLNCWRASDSEPRKVQITRKIDIIDALLKGFREIRPCHVSTSRVWLQRIKHDGKGDLIVCNWKVSMGDWACSGVGFSTLLRPAHTYLVVKIWACTIQVNRRPFGFCWFTWQRHHHGLKFQTWQEDKCFERVRWLPRHPNDIIYLSWEDEGRHWLYAATLTLDFQDLGF